jgi:hypothetical protein
MLLMGFEGTELSPPQQALFRILPPGGVIFFARNTASPEQTYALMSTPYLHARSVFRCGIMLF